MGFYIYLAIKLWVFCSGKERSTFVAQKFAGFCLEPHFSCTFSCCLFSINMVDTEVLTQLFKTLETDQVEVLEDLVGKNGVDVNVCERVCISF